MPNERELQFTGRFSEVVREALKQLTAKEYEISAIDTQSKAEIIHSVLVAARNSPEKYFVIQFGLETFRLAGEALLGEPITGEAGNPDATQAVEEFWRQVVGRSNTALGEDLHGSELEVVAMKPVGEMAGSAYGVSLKSEAATMELSIVFSENFFLSLSPKLPETIQPSAVQTAAHCEHENLDLLLEIPLAVTLRFGERRMPLREILHLSSGAVLELDRQADEPVELCLDDRVIARGQVVVVDGCYGLRVTQICRSAPYGATAGNPA